MKKLFIIFMLLIAISPIKAEMLDVDYNFIDTAFDGIKPVTNKEFDDTINRLTPQPIEDGFMGKLKTFLFGRKYGVEPQAKGQDKEIDYGGELKAIQDIKNGVYYIKYCRIPIHPACHYDYLFALKFMLFYQFFSILCPIFMHSQIYIIKLIAH